MAALEEEASAPELEAEDEALEPLLELPEEEPLEEEPLLPEAEELPEGLEEPEPEALEEPEAEAEAPPELEEELLLPPPLPAVMEN